VLETKPVKMAEIIGAVTGVTKSFLEINTISIDNWGFKLFYKWTTTLCVFSSVLVSGRQFFGEPIKCDAGAAGSGIEQDVLETYCWMYSTFDIPVEYKGPCGGNPEDALDVIVYNSYYQWVSIFLIGLAILFYLPRVLWLMLEGGLMKFFGKGTTTRFIEDQDEKRDKLVEFFRRNIHNKYNVYLLGFIFCEFLNFITVIVVFFLTDRFLHYRYLGYGYNVWQYYLLPPEEQDFKTTGIKNPMCYTFPRISSCNYFRYGTGGAQENISAVCILALNIINDKVFLVLWWWFIFISLVAFFRLVYRGIQLSSGGVRYQLFNMRLNRYFKRSKKLEKIETFVRGCKLGDWFVLYQLSKNLNRPFFMDFLTRLSVIYSDGQERTIYEEDPDDTGDNFLSMLLKPSYTVVEDEKDKKDKKDDKDDDKDEDD